MKMKRSRFVCATSDVAVLMLLAASLHLSSSQDPPSDVSQGLMVTTPSTWVSGTNETVCMVSQADMPPLQASVEISKQQTDGVLSGTKFQLQSGQTICVNLVVLAAWNADEVLLTVKANDADASYTFNKNATVKITRNNLMIFMQTDKPVYKPSDVVRIRILTVTGPDLKPASDQISLAYIEDPSRTRIMQWTNITTSHGLGSIEMPLSSEPHLGIWTLKAIVQGQESSLTFEVKEYVLPKYSVQIVNDASVYYKAPEIKWKVCAKYTYGEPVAGRVTTNVCKKTRPWVTDEKRCVHYNKTTLKNGCFEFTAQMSQLMNNTNDYYARVTPFDFFAKVEESGTGIVFNSTSSANSVTQELTIDFTQSPTEYKPGMVYHGQGKVKNLIGLPVTGKKIDLHIKGSGYESTIEPLNLTVMTDEAGNFLFNASAQFTSSLGRKQFVITGTERTSQAAQLQSDQTDPWGRHNVIRGHYVKAWYSLSDSYLQIQPLDHSTLACNAPSAIPFVYTSKTKLSPSAQFHYQITSNGNLLITGGGVIERGPEEYLNEMYTYNFTLHATVSSEQASLGNLNLLVFHIRPDGEMIADGLTTTFEFCFKNKVTATFSESRVQPGHGSSLKVSADADSLCSITVVDKSVELMGAKYMSKASIKNILKSRYDLGTQASRFDYSRMPGCRQTTDSDSHDDFIVDWRRKRSFMMPRHSRYVDSQKPFEDLGLLVLTDLTVVTRPCQQWAYRQMARFDAVPDAMAGRPGLPGPGIVPLSAMSGPVDRPKLASSASSTDTNEAPKAVHRTFFPETWLWDILPVGPSGELEMPVTLPHTITEWVGNGYCVSSHSGLGVSAPFAITAFQPFFVSFTLPYSMIRGEEVAVPVSVFNYLTECLKVSLVVGRSSAFSLVNDSHNVQIEVCGQKAEVFTLYVIPRQLGKINFTVQASSVGAKWSRTNSVYTREQTMAQDIVTRQLLIEAEGKPEEIAQSAFICNSGGGDWSFALPPDTVSDSARGQITVIGDVMGPALSGLDSLLAMPMGCGEQNMLLFAPNIYVLQYLNKTKRLTPNIQTKALSHMQTGYQRELTYRHTDGSYSAFGNSDPEGSIWLTAFVIKSFAQAKPYMFIDDKDLKMSLDWIIRTQLENGCFPQIGKVLHKEMTGGVQGGSNAAALTSFILVALLEAGLDANLPVISNAIRCLDSQSVDDAYTLTLMSYAYSALPQAKRQQAHVASKLEAKAITAEGTKHWETKAHEPQPDQYHHASSANVEATAYVLLSMLQGANMSIVPAATPIVRWLSAQRNSRGGFSSTQDTVLALQALALYAGMVHRDDISMNVRMATDGLTHSFTINKDNSLLLHKKEGLTPHSRVHYSAEGIGCVLVQAAIRFNRLSLLDDMPPNFALTVNVEDGKESKKKCNERLINVCAKYNGSDDSTNMAVVAIKMVSGWIPDKASIQKLKNIPRLGVKRFDIDKNAVQLYFDEFDKRERCFTIAVEEVQQVSDAKPAIVHIYDYYATSSAAFTQYSIQSTCLIRKAKSPVVQEVSRPSNPGKGVNNPKPKLTNCPTCNETVNAAALRSFCREKFVYKVLIGHNSTLKVVSILRYDSTENKPSLSVTYKYSHHPKCSCSSLTPGSEVLISSRKKFRTRRGVWVFKLAKNSRVMTSTAERICSVGS